MGFTYINDEQKIRIPLSQTAYSVLSEDMQIFAIPKLTSIINLITMNFRETAKASIISYLSRRKEKLEDLFQSSDLDSSAREQAVNHLLSQERTELLKELEEYKREKFNSKLYHINNDNMSYLREECKENEFYNDKPGVYIKCIVEEYARLPFIKRERIIRKDIYEIVEMACTLQRMMKIKIMYAGQPMTLKIYPYKILSDSLGTQEYLACYTRKMDESPKDKITASFSMARMEKPKMLSEKAFLDTADKKKIEDDISRLSVQYLLGEPQEIRVRLTESGKRAYHTRLYSRPEKNLTASTDSEYVFFCSEHQAFRYFCTFGADAEIIKPVGLRARMKKYYQQGFDLYDINQTE